MTREQLRDVLKVNFELYKDEPEFFDYITTLVIYLMQYEFDLGILVSGETTPDGSSSPQKVKRSGVFEASSIPLTKRAEASSCPQCAHKIPEATNICPFCLAMIGNRPCK
jgi:hypothetical protein